jgi:ABC-type antimicrobial peptide transport system permease subunit
MQCPAGAEARASQLPMVVSRGADEAKVKESFWHCNRNADQPISAVEAPRRFNTNLISVFALVALFLAAMGIYAVIAFSVSQRKEEIAIRMALGAQRGNIARFVLSYGAKIAALGCALDILGSLAVSRLVDAFLSESAQPILSFTR